MENQELLLDLLAQGAVEGFSSAPRVVETVISRVFVFEQEELVLKLYKRDNTWWNTSMRDLSQGEARSSFKRQDSAFNQFLNPKIYLDLKTATIVDGRVVLVEPKEGDDELVIVMKKQDLKAILTDVLFEQKLALEDYATIGRMFAETKLAIPTTFLPEIETNWYKQMQGRLSDLKAWIESEEKFPKLLAAASLSRLTEELEGHRAEFEAMLRNDLYVSIDCNSENLLFANGELSFIDAYPPKDEWRIGSFEMDIFRTAADIYAFVGKEAYESYLHGVQEASADRLNMELEGFYLLYAALIACPYFLMLSKKDAKYEPKARKYMGLFLEKSLNQPLGIPGALVDAAEVEEFAGVVGVVGALEGF